MGLKAVVTDLKTVAEGHRSLYTKVGSEFVLDVDDGEYKAKLTEFRDNNIDLQQQAATLKKDADDAVILREQIKKFDGMDPEKARDAMEALTKLEEKQLLDAGKIDELLAQRTERMRGDYEGKISALTSASDTFKTDAATMRTRLADEVIDNRLQVAVSGIAAVRKGAMRDVLSRGRDVWQLDDKGQPSPIGTDGNVLYGKDGASPITMDEWAQGLMKDTPYLFEPSSGGGGQGNLDQGGAGHTVDGFNTDAMHGINIEDIASGKVKVAMS